MEDSVATRVGSNRATARSINGGLVNLSKEQVFTMDLPKRLWSFGGCYGKSETTWCSWQSCMLFNCEFIWSYHCCTWYLTGTHMARMHVQNLTY